MASTIRKIPSTSQEVVETNCIQARWHIEHTRPRSKVQCIAIRVFSRKKCKALIAEGKNRILAPTHSYLFQFKACVESQDHKFGFCENDIHRCVEGVVWTFVFEHPSWPIIWSVTSSTNITTNEIMCLGEASFHLSRCSFPRKDIFGNLCHLKEVMMNTKNLNLG
jgi:hypothetical protein